MNGAQHLSSEGIGFIFFSYGILKHNQISFCTGFLNFFFFFFLVMGAINTDQLCCKNYGDSVYESTL